MFPLALAPASVSTRACPTPRGVDRAIIALGDRLAAWGHRRAAVRRLASRGGALDDAHVQAHLDRRADNAAQVHPPLLR
ncbi:MAG: hypothetical protein ACTMIR_03515 [Cellulomonadaceae bacterium]